MALETERSEQHQLSNGFAGLKGFANDIGLRPPPDAALAHARSDGTPIMGRRRSRR